MLKAILVLFAMLAPAFGLVSGLLAVALGENAVPVVALAMLSGMFLAVPASWYLGQIRGLV
jgi:hypothetical protein